MELLAPSGSKEALVAAVQSGADAVYLGGKMYGARANAANFSMEELAWVMAYCRKYGVRVYVTVNTLIFDDEFEELFAYVDQLVDLHVDALILQDTGVAVALRQRYSDLPLHASTQMHLHNVKQVEWAKTLGFTRVVAARETPLHIVEAMAKTGMEIETFVHGALCVSYSGQCLMSSVIGGRSGNRGECAQPCRLPYTLVEEKQGKYIDIPTDGDFLISPKDLNVLEHIEELREAGVTSLKVEGRMKRPEYVAQVISSYRKQLDHALSKSELKEEDGAMAQLFSRGFTPGYLLGALPKDVLNPKTNSHVGLLIGEVTGSDEKYIHLNLRDTLRQGDGIRLVKGDFEEGFTVNFLYQETRLVNQAKGKAALKRHVDVPTGASIYKTTDIQQMDELNRQINETNRRVPVDLKLRFEVGKPAVLECISDGVSLTMSSDDLVQAAKNAPMGEEQLAKVCLKVQDTIFTVDKLDFEILGQGFMPVAQLNALRRKCLEALETKRSIHFTPYQKAKEEFTPNPNKSRNIVTVCVKTQAQKDIALRYGARVYTENRDLLDENTGFIPPRADHEGKEYEVSVMLPYYFDQETARSGDFGLNVSNARSAKYYLDQGLSTVLASIELPLHRIVDMAIRMNEDYGSSDGLEVLLYGKRELMVMRSCPISALYNTIPLKCTLCHQRNFYLKDRKGARYRMEGDETCAMRVYESQAFDRLDEIPYLKENGITNVRVILDQEGIPLTEKILRRIFSELT
ncbi:MAG: DUF3656 domain-containing protein [Erysipelotrichaceae bacterium]